MKIKTLDGDEYEWKISEKVAKGNKRKTSNLHQMAKMLIRKKYPNIEIYEEVPIKISNSNSNRNKLYLDFYLPKFRLAIETNGEQHYSFSPLFHKNKLDFLKSIANDAKKAVWCEINGIDLVVLKYNETDTWVTQI